MTLRDALSAFGDYMASDVSSRQFHQVSVWICQVAAAGSLVLGLVLAFAHRDPKERFDWLEEKGSRYFQGIFRGLAAWGALVGTGLLGFPGQMSPVVVAVMGASPYGFLIDILYYAVASPWQRALRGAPRRCAKCGNRMTRKENTAPVAPYAPEYDTWVCACGEIRVDGYGSARPLASCPECGFKTWETSIRPIRPSTPTMDGESLQIKKCLSCNHQVESHIVVPRFRKQEA